MSSAWSIVAAELRIPWGSAFAAHRMLVVVDPARQAVRQINGLASWFDTPAGRWRHKPVRYLRTDRLRGYDTRTHPRTFLPMHGCLPWSRNVNAALDAGDAQVLLDRLSRADADAALAPVEDAIRAVNALTPGPDGGAGLPYPFIGLGRNSNSFFATVLACAGLPQPTFPRPALLAPGQGDLLLCDHEIARLRERCRAAV